MKINTAASMGRMERLTTSMGLTPAILAQIMVTPATGEAARPMAAGQGRDDKRSEARSQPGDGGRIFHHIHQGSRQSHRVHTKSEYRGRGHQRDDIAVGITHAVKELLHPVLHMADIQEKPQHGTGQHPHGDVKVGENARVSQEQKDNGGGGDQRFEIIDFDR